MTPPEQAAKAIKDATGWDAIPVGNGARVERPNNGPEILVLWSDYLKNWCCQIFLGVSWLSDRYATPEAAIEAVLPRYRAHVAALAADVLPSPQPAPTIDDLCAEVARLHSQLAAAQPVVEWRTRIDVEEATVGAFALLVETDGWRLEVSDGSGDYWIVDSGDETGPAGKAACEAAYRRACGLPAIPACAG